MLTFSSRPPFTLYPKLALPSMKGFEASRMCVGLKWSGTFATPIGLVGIAGFSDSPAVGNGVKAKEGSATPEIKGSQHSVSIIPLAIPQPTSVVLSPPCH